MRMQRRDFLGGLVSAFLARGSAARADTATIAVICRKAWGAKPRSGSLKRHDIKRLTVHHSAGKLTDNRDAPARIRSIQAYHQSKGWADIAYHFIIDRHGHIYRGRASWGVGDTATNYNPRGHLLILCLGHYGQQRVPRAMRRALVRLLAWASEAHGAAPRTIRGHSYYASTACPGANLQALIGDGTLRRAVRRRIAAGGVSKRELCGAAGARRVRKIEAGTD
jgi:hypothetical protein